MHLILLRFHTAHEMVIFSQRVKKGNVDLIYLEFHQAFNPLSDDIAKLIA